MLFDLRFCFLFLLSEIKVTNEIFVHQDQRHNGQSQGFPPVTSSSKWISNVPLSDLYVSLGFRITSRLCARLSACLPRSPHTAHLSITSSSPPVPGSTRPPSTPFFSVSPNHVRRPAKPLFPLSPSARQQIFTLSPMFGV